MTEDSSTPPRLKRGRGGDELWLGIAKIIGQRIRRLRLDHGHSQTELGEVIGVTFRQSQKYERGVNRLPVDKLYRLSRHYGVPTDYFFDETPVAAEGTAGANPRGRMLLLVAREAERLTPVLLRAILNIIRTATNEETKNVR